jgi:hypothetical protein
VIIDPHYEEKHADSITDEIILLLVKTLDGENIIPDQVNPPFSYFVQDKIGGGKYLRFRFRKTDITLFSENYPFQPF